MAAAVVCAAAELALEQPDGPALRTTFRVVDGEPEHRIAPVEESGFVLPEQPARPDAAAAFVRLVRGEELVAALKALEIRHGADTSTVPPVGRAAVTGRLSGQTDLGDGTFRRAAVQEEMDTELARVDPDEPATLPELRRDSAVA